MRRHGGMKMLLGLTLLMVIAVGCSAATPGPSSIALDGSHWRGVTVLGRPVIVAAAPTLVFEEGRVGGTSGCNGFGSTSVAVSGSSIRMPNLAMTAMACEDGAIMEQERAFFTTLQAVTQVGLRDGRLVLSGPTGELVFERVGGS